MYLPIFRSGCEVICLDHWCNGKPVHWCVLDTKDLANICVVKAVEEIEAGGKSSRHLSKRDKMKKKTKNMHDPIKKNKLPLFRSLHQKEPSKDKQKISSLKSDCALFYRLFISGQTIGDLDDCLWIGKPSWFVHHQYLKIYTLMDWKLRLPGKESVVVC